MTNIDERMERLHALLEEDEAWEEPPPTFEPSFFPNPESEANIFSVTDDEVLRFETSSKLQPKPYPDSHPACLISPQSEKNLVANTGSVLPQYELQFGQEAPEGEQFCPLKCVNRYAFEHVSVDNYDKVSQGFFSKGIIFESTWDFFYIYPPQEFGCAAILLIPLRQFEKFLARINSLLHTELHVPNNAAGFVVDFPADGCHRPRYLGRSTDRKMADRLKQALPSRSYRPDNDPEEHHKPTDRSLEAFKKKIGLILAAEQQKKAATKEKKKKERINRQQSWSHSVKRVQRYLGLREIRRGHNEVMSGAHQNEIPQWLAYDEAVKAAASRLPPLAFEKDLPVSLPQEDSVIFICVDVEAHERNHNAITEVGIATLDTTDISAMAPGDGGRNWMEAIRGRHFRIKEYAHHKNSEFVQGCPDDFEFGISEWVSIKDAPQQVSKCFKEPYSKDRTDVDSFRFSKDESWSQKRNIVLVGHDIQTDINYLRQLGYNPSNLSNLQELVDTSSMYRALTHEPNASNLGRILADLDLVGWHLHNAGNDAVYTLQAMIGIAIKSLTDRQDQEAKKVLMAEQITASIKDAVARTQEQQEGWSSEGSDGGIADRPAIPAGLQHNQKYAHNRAGKLSSSWRIREDSAPIPAKSAADTSEKGKTSGSNWSAFLDDRDSGKETTPIAERLEDMTIAKEQSVKDEADDLISF